MKEFQQNIYKAVEELPVMVTRKGESVFVINSVGEYEKLTTIQKKVATSAPQPKPITPEVLNDFRRPETCAWIGCSKEVVGHDKINGRGFCKEHL